MPYNRSFQYHTIDTYGNDIVFKYAEVHCFVRISPKLCYIIDHNIIIVIFVCLSGSISNYIYPVHDATQPPI